MVVSSKELYVNNNSSLVDSNFQQLLGVGSIALAKSQHDRLSALAQSDLMMWRASSCRKSHCPIVVLLVQQFVHSMLQLNVSVRH